MPRLVPLPIVTFADAAALGLELFAWCPTCKASRRVQLQALGNRPFARSRFRCSSCGAPGRPALRPAELLPVGGPEVVAFLSCEACGWDMNNLPIDRPPWNVPDRATGDRFACRGCRRAVRWQIHGPTWRPGAASNCS